jgi:hypothetical protein
VVDGRVGTEDGSVSEADNRLGVDAVASLCDVLSDGEVVGPHVEDSRPVGSALPPPGMTTTTKATTLAHKAKALMRAAARPRGLDLLSPTPPTASPSSYPPDRAASDPMVTDGQPPVALNIADG